MDENAGGDDRLLAEQFEQHRTHLSNVAKGLLGSADEADDAVQEAWLRLQRNGSAEVINLAGWLTTVVGRICLDVLRRRAGRSEEPLDHRTSDAPATREPESEVLLADSLGLALMVVLETLTPPERLAFVLHDVFAVPFEEIAAVLDRSSAATRQLASRARRRVEAVGPVAAGTTSDQRRQRVVKAFLRAARDGDLPGLIAVLDPDVVLRADRPVPELGRVERATGDMAVARTFLGKTRNAHLAVVDGAAGAVFLPDGRLRGALEFVVADDRIVTLDVLADPAVLTTLDVVVLERAPT